MDALGRATARKIEMPHFQFQRSLAAIAETAAQNFAIHQDHDARELEQFCEILPRLLRDADLDCLKRVADIIYFHPQLPQKVKQFLAFRLMMYPEIAMIYGLDQKHAEPGLLHDEVATPDGGQASQLGADPVAAQSQPEGGFTLSHYGALVLVKSDALTPFQIETLIETAHKDVYEVLLSRHLDCLTDEHKKSILAHAKDDEALAELALASLPLEASAASLFLFATRAQRKTILTAMARGEIGNRAVIPANPDAGRLVEGMKYMAEHKDMKGFAKILELLLCCSSDFADRLVKDEGGEPLVVVLAAFGIAKETAARIFLLLTPQIARSYVQFYELMRMVTQLPQATALKLLVEFSGAYHLMPSPVSQKNQAHEPSTRVARERVAAARHALAPHHERVAGEQHHTPSVLSQTG